MSSTTVTYFPKDQTAWSGDHKDINNVRSNEYLGTIEKVVPEPNTFGASIKPTEFKFSEVSNGLSETLHAMKKSAAIKRRGNGRFNAAWNRELQQLESSAALNDSAINQVTIVQFVQKIIGQLQNVNEIAKAFVNIPSNNLRGKIPEGTWLKPSIQVDRLSEPDITHSDFGQTEFRIKRNDIHVYISREDRMEASVDPYTWSIAAGQKQLLQSRDLLALKELSRLEVNSTYGNFSDVTTKDSEVSVPRSNVDSVDQFLEVINGHFTTYRNYIKYIIMHPQDYRAHETNFYVRNNIKQEPTKGYGVTQFTGLTAQGVTAILSPWVPRTNVYCLTDEGAYELDGPKIVDSEYDAKKFADYTPMHDFIKYLIVNPARFGEKISFPISGVTSGTEITTDTQIETLLTPPAVDKNSDANSSI